MLESRREEGKRPHRREEEITVSKRWNAKRKKMEREENKCGSICFKMVGEQRGGGRKILYLKALGEKYILDTIHGLDIIAFMSLCITNIENMRFSFYWIGQ